MVVINKLLNSPTDRPRRDERSPCRRVRAFVDELAAIRVTDLDEVDLKTLLRSARQAQAGVDALIWRVGAEADRLAAIGRSAPAEELLATGGHVRSSTAKKDAVRSRTMNDVAGLRQAAAKGLVGTDHVDSLARRFKQLSEQERQQIDESWLLAKAKTVPPDRFDRTVKDAIDRVRQDHGLKDAQQKRQASEFQHWFDHKAGMGKFSGQLDPERYEAFTNAIDQHTATLATADTRPMAKNANLAAAALVELACNSHKRSPNLPHITVVVDQKTLTSGPHDQSLRETGNGRTVPPETIQRLACNSVLQRVTTNDRSLPIHVGRKHRTATNAQWVALRTIYSGCAWPGCKRPLTWCQIHHITEWKDGGQTDLDNLAPLCATHHHRVHEGQWSIKLKPDRSLEVRRPDGRHHGTTDPPSRLNQSEVVEPYDDG